MAESRPCKFCGNELVSTNGRRYHPDCLEARRSEVVGTCGCGRDLRRRDSGKCSVCRRREQRAKVQPSRCLAEYDVDGVSVRCSEDAYPLMEYCSKHRSDLRHRGEFLDWKYRRDDYVDVIPQKDHSEWRNRILAEQGNRCRLYEVCGRDASNHDDFHLDHDHRCERHPNPDRRLCPSCIRGVLCASCNQHLLGFIEAAGDPLLVTRAVLAYLESSNSQLRLVV